MRRLRLLIYEGPDTLSGRIKMDDQIRRSIHGSRDNGNGILITAIDLDPRKITILQLIRLFYREAAKQVWRDLDPRGVRIW